MKIEMSDQARKVLEKRGGTMAIDFLKPVGWGKVAEVSVDTNVKSKNLAPYRKHRDGDLKILVAPQLNGMASRMRIDAKGALRKSLRVELQE